MLREQLKAHARKPAAKPPGPAWAQGARARELGAWLPAALRMALGTELLRALEPHEDVLLVTDAAMWDSQDVRLVVTDRRLVWLRDDAVADRVRSVRLHDVERRIVSERIVTPDDWDRRYEIHQGATFNLAHTLGQMLHLRPRNRFEDLESVYLVGGGTHPGSGLPVIFESARITSKLVAADLGLPTDVLPESELPMVPPSPDLVEVA